MPDIPYVPVVVTVVAILIILFVPFIRRIVFGFIRLGIAIGAAVIAILGVSLLMNNETIYEKPGVQARIIRFLTENQAATSEKGLSSATCSWPDQPAAAPSPQPAPSAQSAQKGKPAPAASPAPSAAATPATGASAEEEDAYPELMTRSFPGIPRQRLFDLSEQTVNSLGGWKVLKSDPRAGTIECLHTSRFLGRLDDIRIAITPKGDVELCARSEPSNSILSFFQGDLGSNIGHIKQFYETLEPKMDEVYKEEQDKENAKKPKGMP